LKSAPLARRLIESDCFDNRGLHATDGSSMARV
jgi:hypothetical protein